MLDGLTWIAILVAIFGLGAAAALIARGRAGVGFAAGYFRQRTEPRIEVVEQTAMDGKRRLVLIRRDDVEHLLLTGGPVDVVVETGIAARATPAPDFLPEDQIAGAARQVRAFGQRSADAFAEQPPTLPRAPAAPQPQAPELPSLQATAPLFERG